MLIKILPIAFFISLALAACAPGGQAPLPTATLPSAVTPTQQAPVATATRQPSCTVKSPKPTPGPTEESLLPPPSDQDWVKGSDDAQVTIIEYSDFQ